MKNWGDKLRDEAEAFDSDRDEDEELAAAVDAHADADADAEEKKEKDAGGAGAKPEAEAEAAAGAHRKQQLSIFAKDAAALMGPAAAALSDLALVPGPASASASASASGQGQGQSQSHARSASSLGGAAPGGPGSGSGSASSRPPGSAHFLPLVLIKEVCGAFRLKQEQIGPVASKAAGVLRRALVRHEYDARYQAPRNRAAVARMYLPLVPELARNLRSVRELGLTEEAAKKDLLACALFLLDAIPAPVFLNLYSAGPHKVEPEQLHQWFEQVGTERKE